MRHPVSGPHDTPQPSGLRRLGRSLPRPTKNHRATTCDQLTGLLDRSSLAAEFPELVRRARSEHTHVAVLACDIDNFKRVNDEFGRCRGDSVLVAFSGRVCETLRKTENAFRWGGEQFVIAAYGHDAAEAQALAEKLRDTVAARPVGGVPLTVSVGVAVGHDLRDEADDLVAAANTALAAAKRLGRGRVVVAEGSPTADAATVSAAAALRGRLRPLAAR